MIAKRRSEPENRNEAKIGVPLHKEEREELDAAAKRAGLPTATWMRMVCLREAREKGK